MASVSPSVDEVRDQAAWEVLVRGRADTEARPQNSLTEAEGALMAEEHAAALEAISDPERRGFASAIVRGIAYRQGQYRRALIRNHQEAAVEVSDEARFVVRSYDKERHNQVLEFTDNPDRAALSYVIASSGDFGARRGAGSHVALIDFDGSLSASREAEGQGSYRVRYATPAASDAIGVAAAALAQRSASSPAASDIDPSQNWAAIESVPGAHMRANTSSRMAEISHGGQLVSLSGRAAIEDWALEHGASTIDKERLVALDVDAGRQAGPQPSTPSNRSEIEKMEASNTAPATAPADRIGRKMAKPDWETAIKFLESKAGGDRGNIYIPKPGAEYGGEVLFISDTHIVQRVGKASAIAHDLDQLENGKQLNADIDARVVRNGSRMKFVYGQDKGVGHQVTWNQQRADDMRSEMTAWAEKNMTNAKSRDTFLKHVEHFAKDYAAPRQEVAQPPQRQPAQQHAPQRNAPQRNR